MILDQLNNFKSSGTTGLAVLLDPDKLNNQNIDSFITQCNDANIDQVFIGGSYVLNGPTYTRLEILKSGLNAPIVIFPGSIIQIHDQADAILLLSLISGRNADLLIGKHVEAAPMLYKSNLEILSTGYILVNGGTSSAVQYMSQTQPIPRSQINIAVATALAGEMLNLRCIYLEAGSGAKKPVPIDMVSAVKQHISIPLIVGGGIKSAAYAEKIAQAGADIIVVGNAIEKDPNLMFDLSSAVHAVKTIS
ncbi:MAG: geranylgeranylglyceryl/heptaprenylglyceryl phosphate synthase [Saprospiraceae bacterium]|nr:geranylgeranylglyceryl/heptaprenylglyceryl phosphate synthase [Saprospiraceae bacterium]